MTNPPSIIEEFNEAQRALERFMEDGSAIERLERLAAHIGEALAAGGKVLAIGNGGSACDAMHFCEELTGRFRGDRRPLAAIACSDAGYLTCAANDYGYDAVFDRWVRGLGRPGDVLIALSTSGNSPNVVRAVAGAKDAGLTVATLLGRDGGSLRDTGDFEWIVPGRTSDRIQELHMLILHALIHGIEQALGVSQAPHEA